MSIKQLSVFVENKIGRLAEITEILAKANIDICALSVADTTNFGILRLIVDDPKAAEHALRRAGLTVSLTDVIGIGIEDEPGSFAKIVRILSDEGIGIEYLYAFVSRSVDKAYVILRVADDKKAAEILRKNGILLLDPENI